jgi:hypothetical protein
MTASATLRRHSSLFHYAASDTIFRFYATIADDGMPYDAIILRFRFLSRRR